jgi:hypothetical protein
LLYRWARNFPDMRTIGQLAAEPSWKKYSGPLYDRIPVVTAVGSQTYLLGKGKYLKRDHTALAEAAVLEYVSTYKPANWSQDNVVAIFTRTASRRKSDRETGVIHAWYHILIYP